MTDQPCQRAPEAKNKAFPLFYSIPGPCTPSNKKIPFFNSSTCCRLRCPVPHTVYHNIPKIKTHCSPDRISPCQRAVKVNLNSFLYSHSLFPHSKFHPTFFPRFRFGGKPRNSSEVAARQPARQGADPSRLVGRLNLEIAHPQQRLVIRPAATHEPTIHHPSNIPILFACLAAECDQGQAYSRLVMPVHCPLL